MKKKDYEKSVELLKEIVQDCEFKEKIYLVGGCVRDLVLGKTPKDIDLCIDYPNGTDLFIDFLKTKPECSGFVTYNRFKTGKFSLDIGTSEKIDIECVVPRVETYNQGPRKPDTVQQTNIIEDAKRRDFCCNALYKNLLTEEILDPTGKGLDDCKNRILRTPLDPEQTFKDDPLRMLRAIRFACTKNFTIEAKTYQEIDNIVEYSILSMERIRDEFTKIIMSKNAVWGIRELTSRCLMFRISRVFQLNIGFNQNSKYHDKTFGEHSFAVLDHVIKNGGAGLELRLAALFHDIAKPNCYQIKEDGSFSYHGHDKESAKETRKILTDLRYPGEVIDKVVFLIENHMCIKQLYDYSRQIYTGKPKKTRQLIRLLGDNLYDEMKLIEADNMNHRPCWNMPGQTESFLSEVERVKSLQPTTNFTVPVTGECIMTEFRLAPGKIVGEIKQVLQDYYDEDPGLSTPADLLRKYKEEFGGEVLWFVKEGEKYLCFSVEPKKGEYGYWSTPEYEDLEVDSSEVVAVDLEKKISAAPDHSVYISAVLCPRVWRKKARQLKAREIMKEVIDKVFELPQEFREDFKSLELRLDNAPDVYARVKWNDNTIEEWM